MLVVTRWRDYRHLADQSCRCFGCDKQRMVGYLYISEYDSRQVGSGISIQLKCHSLLLCYVYLLLIVHCKVKARRAMPKLYWGVKVRVT